MIGVDPVGSVYTGEPKPYLVEGVGKESWPETLDPSVIDRWITVGDRDAMLTTRRLSTEEGLLGGPSCGMAAFGALQVAEGISDPEAMVVVILPDGGRSYLSKVFNDAWMTQYGFLERPAEPRVGDVLHAGLVTVRTHDRVRDAVALLHEHDVSQLPVVSAHDAQAVVGSIGERGLLGRVTADAKLLDAEVLDVMEPPFPAVAAGTSSGRGRSTPASIRTRPTARSSRRSTRRRPTPSPRRASSSGTSTTPARPTRPARRSSARWGSSRAAWRAPSRAGWRRPTR